MTRRLHACLTCPPPNPDVKFRPRRGLTRHESRVCGTCRAEGRATARRTPDGPVIDLHLTLVDSELRRPDHYAGRGGW